ncbi:unnamed protein product [Plutella xylostella]|uniref:(diamondback moth) hypothetical protein n=1 Tax=Plutella xylostella TaxID=51655 RepID=A0A8S4EAT3_PLUXY|nr:unnamed protein product [Plutella xylostella]
MNSKKHQFEEYRKFLLSRQTASSKFTSFVDHCLISEDEGAKHCFHKIMVHYWTGTPEELFENLGDYLRTTFIPINYNFANGIASFYTNNLNVILKLIKLDFMFPFCSTMHNIDVLFNDQTSTDLFGYHQTLEEIVACVVSLRLNEKMELDLSNFCNDIEFKDKQINFYTMGLLASFKILMLRMGRDTEILNLSNNNLRCIPQEIMNFFIKGPLIGVNLSNNVIASLTDLRVLSRIERLWLEGNPLCADMTMLDYVKQITVKCPRLKELDGIAVNKYGVVFPFLKNYLVNSDRKVKMLAEKFITLYFTTFDSHRNKIVNFYHNNAVLTISKNYTEDRPATHHYATSELQRWLVADSKTHRGAADVGAAWQTVFHCQHDPTSFNVDVVVYNVSFRGMSHHYSTSSELQRWLVADSKTHRGAADVGAVWKTFFHCQHDPTSFNVDVVVYNLQRWLMAESKAHRGAADVGAAWQTVFHCQHDPTSFNVDVVVYNLQRWLVAESKTHRGAADVAAAWQAFFHCQHDPTSFNVDVVVYNLQRWLVAESKAHRGAADVGAAWQAFFHCQHDPTSFNVDVVVYNKSIVHIVVDGVFKEKTFHLDRPERLFHFRRSFVLTSSPQERATQYHIVHEIATVTLASEEVAEQCFKTPVINLNALALVNPDKEEIEAVVTTFTHITHLKREEAEIRLRIHNWDLRKTLLSFNDELRNNSISADRFAGSDISDLSSIDDDDID